MKSTLLTFALLLTTLTSVQAQSIHKPIIRPRPVNLCTAQLVTGRGRVLQNFTVRGLNRQLACQRAERQCLAEKARRSRVGHGPHLYCDVQRRPHRVLKSCRVNLESRRTGRIVSTHLGVAQGVRPLIVKQRACREALQKCVRAKSLRPLGGRLLICTPERGLGLEIGPIVLK